MHADLTGSCLLTLSSRLMCERTSVPVSEPLKQGFGVLLCYCMLNHHADIIKQTKAGCRQPLAPLPQPQGDPPQHQQQQTYPHSSSQQPRQTSAAQQPAALKDARQQQQLQQQPHQQLSHQQQQLQQQSHQQSQPQKRRVREDENSVIVRGNRYTKLECVGRGGSSKVFKVSARPAWVACMLAAIPMSKQVPFEDLHAC